MNDLGIWDVDEATKSVHRLETVDRANAEALLEEVFVRNPSMLMPGLQLVGRQMTTSNGPLDLLGIDSEGRLVVFELKRDTLTRNAVAQAIDYASWLDSLDNDDLGTHIAANSRKDGIGHIQDFEAWYDDHDNWGPMGESLRPIRIVLVGLGANESARRMAGWLAKKGVEIDLLTFHGFRYEGRTLYARQLDSGDEVRKQERVDQTTSRRARTQASRRDAIDSKIDEYGMHDWWRDAVAVLERNCRLAYRANLGITFYKHQRRALSTGVKARGSHKIEIIEPGVARIVFLPAAVDLCAGEFEELRQAMPFDLEPPPNAPTTEQVPDQWSCRLNETGWRKYQSRIEELVRMVDDRWREAVN